MIFLYPLLSNNHEQNPLHMQISPLSEETFNILSNVIKDLNTVITRRHSLNILHQIKETKLFSIYYWFTKINCINKCFGTIHVTIISNFSTNSLIIIFTFIRINISICITLNVCLIISLDLDWDPETAICASPDPDALAIKKN